MAEVTQGELPEEDHLSLSLPAAEQQQQEETPLPTPAAGAGPDDATELPAAVATPLHQRAPPPAPVDVAAPARQAPAEPPSTPRRTPTSAEAAGPLSLMSPRAMSPAELEAQLRKCRREASAAAEALAEARAHADAALLSRDRAREERDALRAKLDGELELRAQLDGVRGLLDRSRAASADLEAELEALRRRESELSRRISGAEAERAAREAEVVALQQEVAHRKESAEGAGKSAAAVIAGLEGRLTSAEESARAERERARKLDSELAALSAAKAKEAAELSAQRNESDARAKAAAEALERFKAEAERKAAEAEEKSGALLQAEREARERAVASVARLEAELAAATRAREEDTARSKAAIAELEARVKFMNDQSSQAMSALSLDTERKDAEADEALRELAKQRAECSQLRAKNKRLSRRASAENDAIVAAVVGASRSSGPVAAATLAISRLKEFNGFGDNADEALMVGLFHALQGAVNSVKDFPTLVAWSHALLMLIDASVNALGVPSSPKPVVQPLPEDSTQPPCEAFLQRLRKLLHTVFVSATDLKQKEIESGVLFSLFEGKDVLGLPQSEQSMPSILPGMLKVFQDAKVSQQLVVQFFDQIAHYIDAAAMNLLLSRPELCTHGSGMAMKMGLATIDNWFSKHPTISESREKLCHALEAANLLMVDKKLLTSSDETQKMFPLLSLEHLLQILQNYRPDQNSTATVDPEVLSLMRKRLKIVSQGGSAGPKVPLMGLTNVLPTSPHLQRRSLYIPKHK